MRLLKRDLKTINYKNIDSVQEVKHGEYYNGAKEIIYTSDKSFKGNITQTKGDINEVIYGYNTHYSYSIITTDNVSDLRKDSVIWLDDINTTYKIVAMVKSINHTNIAIIENEN